jgi:peptidoglycan/LPS O-acetylase OafA/YrhL
MMLEKRVDSIDSLRGVAILMVILYHVHAWIPGLEGLPSWYKFPISLGFSGVDLFFVLSGFSLYYAWLRQEQTSKEVNVKKYYWRRFWRIYPPYLIAFLIPWIHVLFSTPIEAIKEALWHILLLHNYSEVYFYGANGPLWSIAVEAQFYLLFPLIVLMMKRWGAVPVVVAGIVIGLIYRTGVSMYFDDLSYRQVPKPYLQGFWLARIPNFLLGILLAFYWTYLKEDERHNPKQGLFILLSGMVMLGLTWMVIFYFRHGSMIFRELGFAIGYTLIVLGVLKGALHNILSINWLLFSGKNSYSLYLTHAPVILLIGHYARKISDNISILQGFIIMLISIAICYLVAWLFNRWIETPFFYKAKTYH